MRATNTACTWLAFALVLCIAAPAIAQEAPPSPDGPPEDPLAEPLPAHPPPVRGSPFIGTTAPPPPAKPEPAYRPTEVKEPGVLAAGIVVIGVGLAAVVAGGVTAALAVHPNQCPSGTPACPATVTDDTQMGVGVSLIFGGVYVAAVIGIPIAYFGAQRVSRDNPVRAQLRIAPGAVRLTGSF